MTPWTGAEPATMAALLVIRQGVPPVGGDEAIAEAGGAAILVGSDCAASVTALPALRRAWYAEVGEFAPGAWAGALAPVVRDIPRLVLPGSPDGRDLAPRLAAELDRPLLAGAVRVLPDGAELLRRDGQLAVTAGTAGPFVTTLVPGVRGSVANDEPPQVSPLDITVGTRHDAEVLQVLDPDPATADLAEAPVILGAGAGLAGGDLSGPEAVKLLERTAAALGGSLGATRVVTDAGWASQERQIGTTGAIVDPRLYIAFGVSGAVQHIGGLGDPRHVVSVNTDASAPMTEGADLGLVTDAAGLLRELSARLGVTPDASCTTRREGTHD